MENYGTVTEIKLIQSEDEPKIEERKFNSIHFRIEPIIFFYVFAVIASFPLIQQFLFKNEQIESCLAKDDFGLYCGNSTEPDFDNVTKKDLLVKAQEKSSEKMRNILIAVAIPSMIVAPLFGAYSDDVGRRPGLIMPAFGRTVVSAFMIATVCLNLPITFFYLGSLLEGFSGGLGVYLANVFALIADVTSVESRIVAIVIAEVFIWLAVALAGIITGILIKELDFKWTFVFYGAIAAINLIYVVFIIREPRERPNSECTCNKFTAYLVGTFKTYTKSGPNLRRLKLLVFLFLFMVCDFTNFTQGTFTNLYQMGKPFYWNSERMGYFMSIQVIVMLFGAVAGLYVMDRVLKFSLLTITGIGFISTTAKLSLNAFAETDWQLYLVIPVGIFATLPVAILRALLSKTAGKDEQGEVFAGVAFIESIVRMVGGAVAPAVFQATVAFWPGFMYLVIAILNLFGCIICLVMYVIIRRNDEEKADNYTWDWELINSFRLD